MRIRDEKNTDREAISRLQHDAFTNHPLHAPGSEPVEHLIVERLRDAGALALSLVAEEELTLLGHIALSPAAIGEARQGWYLLGPVGVLPARQRQGIGSALVREAITRLRALGAAGIVLVGDPGFYGRFGFVAGAGPIWPGVPEQYVLALSLAGGTPAGAIEGHAAFGCA